VAPHPPTNFLTLLSLGLVTRIHGSERRGGRAKDWRSSSHIVEPYWFWMAWSRSKIRQVHKRGEYTILHYEHRRRFFLARPSHWHSPYVPKEGIL